MLMMIWPCLISDSLCILLDEITGILPRVFVSDCLDFEGFDLFSLNNRLLLLLFVFVDLDSVQKCF